jgi:ankyrin repeat protein
VEAESLNKVLEISIENNIPELLVYALKLKGNFTKEELKATYGYNRETILHFAAREGQTEVVKVILESFSEKDKKELLSMRDIFASTPLHFAAREGQTEVVKMILGSLSEKDKKELLSMRDGAGVGYTPLHWAVYNGQTKVVKMILESLSEQDKKELLSIRNGLGYTSLHSAVYSGKAEVVKVILESLSEQDKKELINAKRNGETPLDMAIGSNSESEMKKLLREYGAKTAAEINRLYAFVGGIIGLTLGSTALYSLHAFTSFPKDIIISSAAICAGFAITGAIVGHFADTVKEEMVRNYIL